MPKEPSSRLLIPFLQGVIACSALALFFIFAYAIFDRLDIGRPSSVDTTSKSIKDVVAAFGNKGSGEFIKDLFRKFPMAKTMMGKVDELRREPDGNVHMRGWMLDRNELGQQLFVFLIIPKKAVLMSATGKPREDVSGALGLPKESAIFGFDDIFNYKFNCADNENSPYVVAFNQKDEFYMVNPSIRIAGCP